MNGVLLHNVTAGWHPQRSRPRRHATGWDEVEIEGFYYAPGGSSHESIASLWTIGQSLGWQQWLVDIEAEPWLSNIVWNIRLLGKGLLGARPPVITAGAAANQTEARASGDIKLMAFWPKLCVEVTYVHASSSPPSPSQLGTHQYPPWGTGYEPTNPWVGAYTTLYEPNGWILADRRLGDDPLPGNPPPAWLVTDRYEYIQSPTP